jgi:predicted HicB family RNase H-like nuclease
MKKAILLRTTPAIHRAIAYAAAAEHMSINAWINRTLREATKK